jgi:hypothetical protein
MAKVKMTQDELTDAYLHHLSPGYMAEELARDVENWDMDTLVQVCFEVEEERYLSYDQKELEETFYERFLDDGDTLYLEEFAKENNIICTDWKDDNSDNEVVIPAAPIEKKCTCGALKGGGTHSSWCDIL